ncbi:MAG: hypothetical protein Tsb0021_12150 [Chlamydiales bacterium]
MFLNMDDEEDEKDDIFLEMPSRVGIVFLKKIYGEGILFKNFIFNTGIHDDLLHSDNLISSSHLFYKAYLHPNVFYPAQKSCVSTRLCTSKPPKKDAG